MPIDTRSPLFQPLSGVACPKVMIEYDGVPVQVIAGISVAAALLEAGVREFRRSIVGNMPRAPYCMMGVCFECFVEIDGVPNRQSCMTPVRAGMCIRRQDGAPDHSGDGDGDRA
ncbi:NAD(FAD)-dependent dehydrogenase [Caballeronia sordidicola]|uniref:NAD(FAD)-dependent dehydrogenase n=1 Tax=Caballeronia sordidicola TaxID=196367 RepID=A0A158HQX1_CABSO|nr:(2Fe-2S)-binding protein [Caballeronia sordidicola]SAL46080.1 NAD(FAD)-dependent dehydrogenase [Caballeronia sordidicola]